MVKFIVSVFLFLFFVSCKKKENEIVLNTLYKDGEEFLGGAMSTTDFGVYSFEHEFSKLSNSEKADFFIGNSFFKQSWVTSPASTTARDGLGPFFNARSCSSCHPNDGRGRPPRFEGELQQGLLFRLYNGNDQWGGPLPDAIYGGQLQDQSILGVGVEGTMQISYELILGQFADGKPYTLEYPKYTISNLLHGALDANTQISARVGQQLIGLGLLDALSEQSILANQDIYDANNDGISGKANYVWSVEDNKIMLGKFGWKANQPTLKQQASGAFNGDLGITSTLFPNENCNPWQDCSSLANGGAPEISDEHIRQQVIYLASLTVPIRRNFKDQEVLEGKQIFSKIQCVSCHKDNFTTEQSKLLSGLSSQRIRPYTDLLLHDMGDSLSDKSKEYLAEGNEWRTPPLWGVGLLKTVNGHQNLLHDGRAKNIEEAILWHGGEATKSRDTYKKLTEADRKRLIKFIESL